MVIVFAIGFIYHHHSSCPMFIIINRMDFFSGEKIVVVVVVSKACVIEFSDEKRSEQNHLKGTIFTFSNSIIILQIEPFSPYEYNHFLLGPESITWPLSSLSTCNCNGSLNKIIAIFPYSVHVMDKLLLLLLLLLIYLDYIHSDRDRVFNYSLVFI